MNKHWTVPYIGIPYVEGGREKDGLDCWGFLRLVYRDLEGIDLPLLPGVTVGTALTISREIVDSLKESWIEVPTPSERCGVAMSLQEIPHHVGVWTEADGGLVVHAWNGTAVAAETLRRLRIKGFRSIKFYRYGFHS